MSIIRLGKDNFERFSVIARPTRTFSSSSGGVTGSVPVFARTSTVEKDVDKATFVDSEFSTDDPESIREAAKASDSTNISSEMSQYIDSVNALTRSELKNKKVESIRFEPPFTVNSDFLRKSNVRTNLFQYYRGKNRYAHWNFANYQCLNFFTSSTVPSDSVIIYDNQVQAGNTRGPYTPDSAFSLECYINPRYQNEINQEYKPGTIYHLSSTFALSLCSGSSTDGSGRTDKFKLMIQLSSSAEVQPSAATPGNLIFTSSDNCLNLNSWHHVVVRWSPDYDNGSGSFVVDGTEVGYFHTTASSISPIFNGVNPDQDVLFIGNYFDGQNVAGNGTAELLSNPTSPTPIRSFSYPLNAEVHEMRIWDSFIDDSMIASYMTGGLGSTDYTNLLFYLPVLFVKESPERDVFVTPFEKTTQSTVDAHNVSMSFGVGGHEVNVENFVREFVQGNYPVLYSLTGSEITWNITDFKEANELLYATGSFIKRNLTILPCDNGIMRPNYSLLLSGSMTDYQNVDSPLSKFTNDFGNLLLDSISLNDLLPTSSLYPGLIPSDSGVPSSISELLEGSIPESLNSISTSGDVLSIFQRQRDNTSNSVVFFDTSNLFYGGRVHPTSFSVTDTNLTGSGGKVQITLCDNGQGGLYRADSLTPHPKWAGVGTILYDEGIAVVKSPLIFMFGKDQFDITLRGERKVHVMEIAIPCPAGMVNSSSNPTFMALTASDDLNETSVGPVIITGLNLHDDNMNVVARVALAQPIIKREEDRYLFRVKMDW